MKLSDVNKIEIIRTNSGAWNANVDNGPWACYATPEKALEKLLSLLCPTKRIQPTALAGLKSKRLRQHGFFNPDPK